MARGSPAFSNQTGQMGSRGGVASSACSHSTQSATHSHTRTHKHTHRLGRARCQVLDVAADGELEVLALGEVHDLVVVNMHVLNMDRIGLLGAGRQPQGLSQPAFRCLLSPYLLVEMQAQCLSNCAAGRYMCSCTCSLPPPNVVSNYLQAR